MFQIAICDDDKIFYKQFMSNLEAVVKKLNIECNISLWHEGESLQKYLTNKNRVDLLFLDIELLELDGVSLGRFIHQNLFDFQMCSWYISLIKKIMSCSYLKQNQWISL